MLTISHELFRTTADPKRKLLAHIPRDELLLTFMPEDIQEEFRLNGWFLMGEFAGETTSITTFWTISHSEYDHSLVLISKMNPFAAEHLLLGCITNAQLDREGGLYIFVVDTFAMLSPGLEPFLDSLPTWFLVNEQPGALVYVTTALRMMLDAAPRYRDKIFTLLTQLESFKRRPWDRIASRRRPTERATAAYADRRAGETTAQDLDRLCHLLSQPQALKSELELLSERPERLYDDFHVSDTYGPENQEKGRNLERWYMLMLEPGYLASELEATLSWWQDLSLDARVQEAPRKKVKNDVLRLLEFLRRLNFNFAKRATPEIERPAEVPKEGEWYSTLNARTRNWLAKAKIKSVPGIVKLKLHSKIPPGVRKQLGEFQYAEQVKNGFDPRTPLAGDEIRLRLMNGGLLFRGTKGIHFGGPWAFLSLGHIRDGWVLCARRGSVFLRGLEQERDYLGNMVGFEKIYVPGIREPRCWFGVLKLIGFEQVGEDLDLSREIFGLDYGSLQALLDAYEQVTRSSEKSGLLRITYSKQDKECDVSRKLIPARFPYIAIRDVGNVGTAICLHAFYDHLALLTCNGKKGGRMVRAFEESGVDPGVWARIEMRGGIWPWSHAIYERYIQLKVTGWRGGK